MLNWRANNWPMHNASPLMLPNGPTRVIWQSPTSIKPKALSLRPKRMPPKLKLHLPQPWHK
jgi:hypothetical protein